MHFFILNNKTRYSLHIAYQLFDFLWVVGVKGTNMNRLVCIPKKMARFCDLDYCLSCQ
jgi:hypothetical protein